MLCIETWKISFQRINPAMKYIRLYSGYWCKGVRPGDDEFLIHNKYQKIKK